MAPWVEYLEGMEMAQVLASVLVVRSLLRRKVSSLVVSLGQEELLRRVPGPASLSCLCQRLFPLLPALSVPPPGVVLYFGLPLFFCMPPGGLGQGGVQGANPNVLYDAHGVPLPTDGSTVGGVRKKVTKFGKAVVDHAQRMKETIDAEDSTSVVRGLWWHVHCVLCALCVACSFFADLVPTCARVALPCSWWEVCGWLPWSRCPPLCGGPHGRPPPTWVAENDSTPCRCHFRWRSFCLSPSIKPFGTGYQASRRSPPFPPLCCGVLPWSPCFSSSPLSTWPASPPPKSMRRRPAWYVASPGGDCTSPIPRPPSPVPPRCPHLWATCPMQDRATTCMVCVQAGGVITVVVSVLYATVREGDEQLSWMLVFACVAVVLGTHHLLMTPHGQDGHGSTALGAWTLVMSAGDTGGGMFHDDDEALGGGDTGANASGTSRIPMSAHARRVRPTSPLIDHDGPTSPLIDYGGPWCSLVFVSNCFVRSCSCNPTPPPFPLPPTLIPRPPTLIPLKQIMRHVMEDNNSRKIFLVLVINVR